MNFSPLFSSQSVTSVFRSVASRVAYGEQFRLWVPEVQLNLVYGRAVLEGV